MADEDGRAPQHGCSLEAYLEGPSLTEGQRRRLRLFQAVEGAICARIERICTEEAIDVTDVAVLVVAPEVRELFFGDAPAAGPRQARDGGPTSVVLGHRDRLHAFLHGALPPSEDAPFDPYADLTEPAPARCVRVLIVDHESLTVMSYGTFVTVSLDSSRMPRA
ncbi:MAG: hypothetical protein IT372_02775 [Polyangiaceae bacterium]|nr:hypothetical protein [Polyangiaceae bacterium]